MNWIVYVGHLQCSSRGRGNSQLSRGTIDTQYPENWVSTFSDRGRTELVSEKYDCNNFDQKAMKFQVLILISLEEIVLGIGIHVVLLQFEYFSHQSGWTTEYILQYSI